MIKITQHAIERAMERHNLGEAEFVALLEKAADPLDATVVLRKVRGSHHRLVVQSGQSERQVDMMVVNGHVVTVLPSEKKMGSEYARFIRFHQSAAGKKFRLEVDFPGFVLLEEAAAMLTTKFSVVSVNIQIADRLVTAVVELDSAKRLKRLLALRDADTSSTVQICDPDEDFFRFAR